MIATLGRRRLRLPSPALAVAVLVVLLVSTVADSVYDKRQQLQGLNNQIISAKTHLGQLFAQERSLQAEIAALDAQLKRVTEQIQEETAKLEQLKLQVQAATQQLAAKEAELHLHIDNLSKEMRQMYKRGEVSGVELVFSAGNFADLMNRVFFFEDIIRADRREVAQLQQERQVIAALKADLEAKRAQQAQVVQTIKTQQAQLEATRSQRAADEAQVAAIAAQFQRELNDMEAQRATLQSQIASLLSSGYHPRSTGKWNWPIAGIITQGFGCTTYPFEPYDPSCPSKHFHSGIDIANDYGTPVHASDGGIVRNFLMTCSWNPGEFCGYGRYVVIVHAGGFTSLYGHLSGWGVADGTQVEKDAVIGYEGTTGNSTGPHLHFEIDLAGTPVDPIAYLP